jgi:hypothetical protein
MDFCCHSVGAWVPWANGIYIEANFFVEGPFDRSKAEKRLLMYASNYVQKSQIHGKA